jgi:hypothetical protein
MKAYVHSIQHGPHRKCRLHFFVAVGTSLSSYLTKARKNSTAMYMLQSATEHSSTCHSLYVSRQFVECGTDWPPLWSSGHWLQIQRSGFDSRRYQIFWEVVGLERGPLSLVSTTEELHGRKSSGSGLESREYGIRDPSHWTLGTIYPQKFALTSPTSGGRLIGIVRSRTKATEFINTSTDCK